MGESVTEGTVLEWHKAEGDFVEEGETIVEVSTDKVDAEVPAPASGTITKLLVEVDDVVKVGQALAEIEPGDGDGGSNGSGPRRTASRADETPTATGCRTPAAAARATRTSARASRRNFRRRSRATSRTQERRRRPDRGDAARRSS